MTDRRLPGTVEELREMMAQFATSEAADVASSIVVQPDDVFISTYPKSGTTWLQQVVHQLRTGGSMDFEEISSVVPWLGVAHDMGIDPFEQPWHPRVFKLHRVWDEVPRGARIITAFRSPESVLRSFYRFFAGSFFEAGAISLEDFAHRWFLEGTGSGLYFDHITSFHPHVRSEDVLAFTYEDMLQAPETVVRVVADFLGLGEDLETIEVAIANSTREVMARHVTMFDDHLLADAMRNRTGYPVGRLAKVHAASPDIVIDEDLRGAITARWQETVTPALGYATYEEFREAMPDPLGVRSESGGGRSGVAGTEV